MTPPKALVVALLIDVRYEVLLNALLPTVSKSVQLFALALLYYSLLFVESQFRLPIKSERDLSPPPDKSTLLSVKVFFEYPKLVFI
jgi:hypothetical protein